MYLSPHLKAYTYWYFKHGAWMSAARWTTRLFILNKINLKYSLVARIYGEAPKLLTHLNYGVELFEGKTITPSAIKNEKTS